MNDHNVKDIIKEESANLSDMAVNFVHYDDHEEITSTETVPLAHYIEDFGLTSEVFLVRHQKLGGRKR